MKKLTVVACVFGVAFVLACGDDASTSDEPDAVTADLPQDEDVAAQDLKTEDLAKDTFVPPTDCDIDADCDDHNECTLATCAAGKCLYQQLDGQSCDDGDTCTLNDVCVQSQCLGLAIVCDDGNDCTEDGCKDGQCTAKALSTTGCKLEIVLDSPGRASTLFATGAVEIVGKVNVPVGEIDSLTLNGTKVSVQQDGSFESAVSPSPGINILDFVAMDTVNRSDRLVSSFLYAEELYQVGTDKALVMMPNSTRAFLRADLWDDNDNTDLDDFASVAFAAVNTLDVGQFIPSPLFAEGEGPTLLWCEWTLDISDISYELEDIDLTTLPGSMIFSGSFVDLAAYVDAVAEWCPDAHGWVYADRIEFSAKLEFWVANGDLYVEVVYIDVEIVDVLVDMEGGAASLFDWLINWFTGPLANKVETELEAYLPEKLIPLLVGLLNSFLEQNLEFEIPPIPGVLSPLPLVLKTEPVEVDLTTGGSAFGMSIGVGSKKLITHKAPGTLKRGDCKGQDDKEFELPKSQKIEAAVSEDLVNQLLFALWWGGHLNFTIDGPTLGELVGFGGLEGLEVTLEPHLPPIYTSCTDSGKGEIQLGDLSVVVSFTMGGDEGVIDMFVSALVEAEIVVVPKPDKNSLGLAVGDVVALGIDVVETEGVVSGAENLMEQLLTDVVVNLLIKTYLVDVLAAFPIPYIDLGAFEGYFPEGTVVGFNPVAAQHILGFFVLSGNPKTPE